jgi:hypothetical protein
MTACRVALIVLASMLGAAIVLVVVAAASMAIAAGTGRNIRVPGLLEVTAGRGSDLASATVGSSVLVWYAALTVILVGLELLHLRTRRRDV